jgi:hypothetical protein
MGIAMKIRHILLASLAIASAGPNSVCAFGYFGPNYNVLSLAFGQAFGQLSPADQAVFGLYDGSNFVAMRNQIYDNIFGINSVPGGFPAILNAFDNRTLGIVRASNPSNLLPPVFDQITSMGACIPGFTVTRGGGTC